MAVNNTSHLTILQFQHLVAKHNHETDELIKSTKEHPEYSRDGSTLELRIEQTYQASLAFRITLIKHSLYQLNAARYALVDAGIGMTPQTTPSMKMQKCAQFLTNGDNKSCNALFSTLPEKLRKAVNEEQLNFLPKTTTCLPKQRDRAKEKALIIVALRQPTITKLALDAMHPPKKASSSKKPLSLKIPPSSSEIQTQFLPILSPTLSGKSKITPKEACSPESLSPLDSSSAQASSSRSSSSSSASSAEAFSSKSSDPKASQSIPSKFLCDEELIKASRTALTATSHVKPKFTRFHLNEMNKRSNKPISIQAHKQTVKELEQLSKTAKMELDTIQKKYDKARSENDSANKAVEKQEDYLQTKKSEAQLNAKQCKELEVASEKAIKNEQELSKQLKQANETIEKVRKNLHQTTDKYKGTEEGLQELMTYSQDLKNAFLNLEKAKKSYEDSQALKNKAQTELEQVKKKTREIESAVSEAEKSLNQAKQKASEATIAYKAITLEQQDAIKKHEQANEKLTAAKKMSEKFETLPYSPESENPFNFFNELPFPAASHLTVHQKRTPLVQLALACPLGSFPDTSPSTTEPTSFQLTPSISIFPRQIQQNTVQNSETSSTTSTAGNSIASPTNISPLPLPTLDNSSASTDASSQPQAKEISIPPSSTETLASVIGVTNEPISRTETAVSVVADSSSVIASPSTLSTPILLELPEQLSTPGSKDASKS